MPDKKDGGAAFPRPPVEMGNGDRGHDWWYMQDGMSLRDWLAGQALQGALASMSDGMAKEVTPELIAFACYKMADAMLVARDAETP